MAIEFVQLSSSTSTEGALVAADLIDFAGGATEVSVQMIKFGYGTDGVFNEVATGQGIPMATGPVYQIQQMATATSPVSIGTWTATGQVLTSPLASATGPVSVGTWTATGQVLTSPLATATQPVSVATWTATGIVRIDSHSTATIPVSLALLPTTATLPVTLGTNEVFVSVLATATAPVSVGTWTATGEVRVIQDLDTATDHNVTTHPFGPFSDQVKAYLDITSTGIATLATSPGANNFNDLVGLYVSNHATSPQSVSIRETSTATWHNPMLAADGGGFIWQPAKPTRQEAADNAWSVQTSAATGIKIAAQFMTAT